MLQNSGLNPSNTSAVHIKSLDFGPELASDEQPASARRDSGNPASEHAIDFEKQSLSEQENDLNDIQPFKNPRHEEIEWRYLTFETALPHPTTIYPAHPSQPPPPEPPSLMEYTNPFDWSDTRKSITLWISCVMTTLTAFAAGAYAPGAEQMSNEWGVSKVAILVGIPVFTTGFAIAPMVLAPFSEINGRRPVIMASGILYAVCQLCCGVTRSYAGMLVARFFLGVGGSTFSTMIGGIISDIYHKENRNTSMSIFTGAVGFGTGLGPLLCGFVAQNTTWRWMFYMQTISCGTMVALTCIFFKETRGSVVLSSKAKALNEYYAAREAAGCYGFNVSQDGKEHTIVSRRIRWKVKADEERASLRKMISISVYRPFHLLVTEPVVFWFSMWISFAWGILYLTLAAIPLVFMKNYGFSLQQANSVFAAMSIASIPAAILAIYQEKLARRCGKLLNTPEARLYFVCVEGFCMPVGMFVFGWTASARVHWIVPTIAISVVTIGILMIYLAVFNYLADTYHRYASSALAAQSFCRNMVGGTFPVLASSMYNRLGYGPASSLLGGIGTLLALVPWVLVLYGPRIRARSKFASEIMNITA